MSLSPELFLHGEILGSGTSYWDTITDPNQDPQDRLRAFDLLLNQTEGTWGACTLHEWATFRARVIVKKNYPGLPFDLVDPEAVADEALMRMFHKGPEIQAGNPESWLNNALVLVAKEFARKARNFEAEELPTILVAPDTPKIGPGLPASARDLMNQLYAELSPSLREIAIPHFRENKSHQEIAIEFGLSEATVRKRVSRATTALRNRLKEIEAMAIERLERGSS